MMSVKKIFSEAKRPRIHLRLDKRSGRYYSWSFDFRFEQKRYRKSGFASRSEAEAAENALRSRLLKKSVGLDVRGRVPTVRELMDERIKAARGKKARQTVRRAWSSLLDVIPAGYLLTELSASDIYRMQDRLEQARSARGLPFSPHTIDRRLTEISAGLRAAHRYFPDMEEFQPPRVPRPRLPDTRRERVIGPEEFARLLEFLYSGSAARQLVGHQLEFAALTSSRRKEVVKLKWSDYFPDQDLLKITRWKTLRSGGRSVTNFSPLPERVREILTERRDLSEGEYIFSRRGENSQSYLSILKRACSELEIPYGRFTSGGLIFHDTRHTFVTNILKAGADIETARELAGLSREMILKYAHSSAEQKKRAIRRLEGRERREEVKTIYEMVRAGKMDFETFWLKIRGYF